MKYLEGCLPIFAVVNLTLGDSDVKMIASGDLIINFTRVFRVGKVIRLMNTWCVSFDTS